MVEEGLHEAHARRDGYLGRRRLDRLATGVARARLPRVGTRLAQHAMNPDHRAVPTTGRRASQKTHKNEQRTYTTGGKVSYASDIDNMYSSDYARCTALIV